jgi:IS6 family transposase
MSFQACLYRRGITVEASSPRGAGGFAPFPGTGEKWPEIAQIMKGCRRSFFGQRGEWLYLDRVIDKHGAPVDFMLNAKRDLDAAPRFFRTALKDEPLLAPMTIGIDDANVYPTAIREASECGLVATNVRHRVSKHLQQGIESDHFRVKRAMPKVGGFRTFATARRTIAGFEAMLRLRKGFGFAGTWTVRRQNELLAQCFGPQMVNEVSESDGASGFSVRRGSSRQARLRT